jgi:hypothetical protein
VLARLLRVADPDDFGRRPRVETGRLGQQAQPPRVRMNAESCSANCCLVVSALLVITYYSWSSSPATMERCGWFTTGDLTPLKLNLQIDSVISG